MDLHRTLGRSLDAARKAHRIIRLRRKIAGIAMHRREFPHHDLWTSERADASRRFLRANGMGYSPALWHECYTGATGRYDTRYIPEDYFYLDLLPSLNALRYVRKYGDKNYYEALGFPNLPRTLGRISNGRPIDERARIVPLDRLLGATAGFSEVVIKPTLGDQSGGGAMVTMCAPDAVSKHIERFTRAGVRDLVVQEPVTQHQALAGLNASSVNTVRCMTLRIDNRVTALSSVVRIGRQGARVDNGSSGGLACGVEHDGCLKRYAYSIKTFERFARHPDDPEVAFAGRAVPAFATVRDFCIDVHERVPDVDMVSWDIAVDPQARPVLIEFNMGDQEINFHQLANGPLFGEHTERVLAAARAA
jgi:hypothetical protein